MDPFFTTQACKWKHVKSIHWKENPAACRSGTQLAAGACYPWWDQLSPGSLVKADEEG